MIRFLLLLIAACLAAWAVAAAPPEPERGPYPAQLVRVIDGDTVELAISIFPGLTLQDKVRLAGVDTPEIHGKVAPCEKRLGDRARAFTARFLERAASIVVLIGEKGRYGRWIGHIRADGRDLAEALLAAGLARPYAGGKREPWCE